MITAVINICGRREYTEVTLESLNRSDAVAEGEIQLCAMVVDKPSFPVDEVRNLLSRYEFATLPVIEQKHEPENYNYGVLYSLYLAVACGQTGHILYMENDILFHKDWLKRLGVPRYGRTSLVADIKTTQCFIIDIDTVMDVLREKQIFKGGKPYHIDKRLYHYLEHINRLNAMPALVPAIHIGFWCGMKKRGVARAKIEPPDFRETGLDAGLKDLYDKASRV